MSLLSSITKLFKGVGSLAPMLNLIPGLGNIPTLLQGLGYLSGNDLKTSDLLGILAGGADGGMLNIKGGDLSKVQDFLATDKGKTVIGAMRTNEDIAAMNAEQRKIASEMNKVLAASMNLYKTTDLNAVDAKTIAEFDKVYDAEANRDLTSYDTSIDNPDLFDLNRAVQRGAIRGGAAEKKARLRGELEQSRPFRQLKLIPDIGGYAGALATQAQYDLGREQQASRLYNNSSYLNTMAGRGAGGNTPSSGGSNVTQQIMDLDLLPNHLKNMLSGMRSWRP